MGGNPVLAMSMASRKEKAAKLRLERVGKLENARAQLASHFSRTKQKIQKKRTNLSLERDKEERERQLMFLEDVLLQGKKKRRESKMVLLGKSQSEIARERKLRKRKSRMQPRS